MAKDMRSRVTAIIEQFSLPKPDNTEFIDQMVVLLSSEEIGEIDDDELFKVLLSSYNVFFFSSVNSIDVQFTEECNLRCNYCFVRDKRENSFSAEMGKRALDFLVLNSGKYDKLDYTFFGGEPLLEFDKMYEVMLYSDEVTKLTGKEVVFNATTNGVLLTEDIMRKSQGRLNYLLSIDGDEWTHDKHRVGKQGAGSFKHVFPKISLIKKFQPWVGARLTVCPDTVERLFSNVEFLYKSGVNQFLIGASVEMDWSEKQLATYEEQYRLLGDYYLKMKAKKEPIRIQSFEKELDHDCSNGIWGCWAGRNHVVVTYTGDLYPCSKFIGLESYDCKEFYLGNIFEGFTEMKAREKIFNLQGDNFETCKSCAHVNECVGGCPADNYAQNKDLYVPCTTGCDMVKMTKRVMKDYWEKKKEFDRINGAKPD